MLTPESHDAAQWPSRVVLVEDNEGDVYLVRLALREAGFPQDLTVFRDGADAIAAFRNARSTANETLPDLLLVDLNLPRLGGNDLVEILRTDPAFDGVPVILMSSSSSPEDRARANRFAKCIYALKPSNLPDFMKLGFTAREFWMQSRQMAAAV